jgi:Tfp pilus assembly protein FimT
MTLVELLVVLGVIGIVVGMSVPALTGYTKQVRLRTATRQVVGLVSLARSLAISSHEDHAVVVDPANQEISVINVASGQALEQVVRLPSSMTVGMQVGGEPSAEMQLVFRPTGSLTGRTVSFVLADRDKVQTITVTGATGSVSVE